VKAAPVVSEIDEAVLYGDLPDVPHLKKSEEAGVGRVFAGEDDGGRADVDRDDIKAALDQEHGIVPRSCPDIQGLTHRYRPGFHEPNKVRIRASGVPGEGGRGG